MKKRLTLIALMLIFAVLLASCGGAADTGGDEGGEEAAAFNAAIVMPNPLGDRSFIDSSARGIEQANSELDVDAVIVETQGVAEHEAALRGAIQQGYDIVLGLAIDAELFVNLAEEFPDQKFGSPSEIFAEDLPDNLAAYTINVHESSFLVGLIVGSLTETKTVGAVVGGDAPALNQFYWGYKQGVLEVCPDCEVLVSYLGFDFANPTLGQETAIAQYDAGADIIYQVAGLSGEGVLSAAAERDLYAIGVDSNQDDIQPGNIIVSMIKRVDVTTYNLIQSVVDGTYTGGFSELGLADGAAALSWDEGSTTFADNGPASMVDQLPAVQELVEEYRAQILAGEYEVCNALVETPVCDPLK
ncbi:MAG: BMP family ABC transporter substrate-binding protein [Chloroflexi bacterium]|nr:MAG: BMP family ABC transporter substrate-binding protein [Chloroflexota bacterium]MBL1194708.1 BMP family ABC transporter substrate-binding protein [Chloroflexota bacterium]NOH12001.1 BMP family ABC transporter substrate-binding protein [Chloroflexota bacterium]